MRGTLYRMIIAFASLILAFLCLDSAFLHLNRAISIALSHHDSSLILKQDYEPDENEGIFSLPSLPARQVGSVFFWLNWQDCQLKNETTMNWHREAQKISAQINGQLEIYETTTGNLIVLPLHLLHAVSLMERQNSLPLSRFIPHNFPGLLVCRLVFAELSDDFQGKMPSVCLSSPGSPLWILDLGSHLAPSLGFFLLFLALYLCARRNFLKLKTLPANNDGNPSGNNDGNPSANGDGNPSGNNDGNPSGNGDGNPSANDDGNPSANDDGNPSANGDGNSGPALEITP